MEPLVIPSGQEIYDTIMAGIDPELTTAGLETLDTKYATETEDEKAARAARYDIAFAEYDKQFQLYNDQWMETLRTYKRTAIASLEKENRESEEKAALDSIESSLAA